MDLFDSLYKSIIPTEQSVLEAVDEWTLYCFYTGLDDLVLGRAVNAPYYRKDVTPSFSVFLSSTPGMEYRWKDHATGESGSIFQLIKKIENLNSMQEVFARINSDFELGYSTTSPEKKEKITWFNKPEKSLIKIRVQPQPFTDKGHTFWKQWDVNRELLDLYNTEQTKYYWSFEGQQYPNYVPDPTFSYRVGEFYQIYSPYAQKSSKFRNDLPENYFFGYLQLPSRGSTLIITKSMKDVIFCRRLGLNAVASKSETTMLPDKKVLELKERFPTIFIILDNDNAGRVATQKYMDKYPWLLPRFLKDNKDMTDCCLRVGINESERIIKELLSWTIK